MTDLLKIVGVILIGLIAIKVLGIILGLIFGVVGTFVKVILYLLIGLAVVYAIKSFLSKNN